MRAFIGIFLVLVAGLVEARMYQWVNSGTGSSQLSGKPPAWYRASEGGPRVLVFEKNQIVDDTSIKVAEQQRVELRRQAFHISVEEQKKGLTSQEAIARLEEQIKALVESPAMAEYLKSPDSDEDQSIADSIADDKPANGVKTETPDERVERLKSLISRWDERRTKEAKSLLEPDQAQDKKQEASDPTGSGL